MLGILGIGVMNNGVRPEGEGGSASRRDAWDFGRARWRLGGEGSWYDSFFGYRRLLTVTVGYRTQGVFKK
jgi:hypothetical protein